MKEIPLTQGMVALVDDDDFERLSSHKWCAVRNGNTWYARRNIMLSPGVQRAVEMHREILGLRRGDGTIVDHRNLNGLDNQKSNLRTCTTAQNGQNRRVDHRKNQKTTRYRGVSYIKRDNLYLVRVRQEHIGYFRTPEDAALAYNEAARQRFGEFARMNEIA